MNDAAVSVGTAVLGAMAAFVPDPSDIALAAAVPFLRRGAAAAAERGLWRVTREGTGTVLQVSRGEKYYEHASTGLYWSKDNAGHGGSAWKVYERRSDGLHWMADADQYGDFIPGKHKSGSGMFIRNKDLHTSKF